MDPILKADKLDNKTIDFGSKFQTVSVQPYTKLLKKCLNESCFGIRYYRNGSVPNSEVSDFSTTLTLYCTAIIVQCTLSVSLYCVIPELQISCYAKEIQI